MNLIFDLDGTLVDARQRLYRLFSELVPISTLSFDEYWSLKRDGTSHEMMLGTQLGFHAEAIERFRGEWMSRIESPGLLALDENFPGIHVALEKLRGQASLFVCTARQNRQGAIDQLKALGLFEYFQQVLVTEQNVSKVDLLSTIPLLGAEDWMIGDTAEDMQVGKAFGMRTCAVLSGFSSEARLARCSPDVVVATAADFPAAALAEP